MSSESAVFTYDGGRVHPGETAHVRYTVSETYLGDPVRIPVTVVNGVEAGPTCYLSAAIHGDELNGVAAVREVANEWDHHEIAGTVVCLPVVNVPGFVAQQRYLPVDDRDLNRAFPGHPDSTSSRRIAHDVWRNFVAPCDFGIDFHTSTRGRTNAFHVRADMDDDGAARLADAFGANIVLDSGGQSGMLRTEATERGIPTITVEMGEAHRFQRGFVDQALAGVHSVFGEDGVEPNASPCRPEWRTVVDGWDEKTWVQADAGGIVEMRFDRGDLVYEGNTVRRITNPFKTEAIEMTAPFTGLLVGMLENPVVSPGNPICHVVEVEDGTREKIEAQRAQPATASDRRAASAARPERHAVAV
jgi:predicted deacylase